MYVSHKSIENRTIENCELRQLNWQFSVENWTCNKYEYVKIETNGTGNGRSSEF